MKPEHLDLIKACALDCARTIRAQGSECAPVLLLFNARLNGEIGDITPIALDGEKDRWAYLQQKMARAPDIAAAVLITEAWYARLTPGEPAAGPVSERPNREEVLMINVQTAVDQWLLIAQIHGRTIDDAPLEHINVGGPERWEGRFIRHADAN